MNVDKTNDVLSDVLLERSKQHERWGEQHHPNGTSPTGESFANIAKQRCNDLAEQGHLSWAAILTEEFFEALAETDKAALRAELVQVAAVCVAWVEDLDGRE